MTCATCVHWGNVEDGYTNEPDLRECAKTPNCVCCEDAQLFGANGGGTFLSRSTFGCNQWQASPRALASQPIGGNVLRHTASLLKGWPVEHPQRGYFRGYITVRGYRYRATSKTVNVPNPPPTPYAIPEYRMR